MTATEHVADSISCWKPLPIRTNRFRSPASVTRPCLCRNRIGAPSRKLSIFFLFGELGWETADCFHEFEQAGGSPLGRDTAAEVVLVRRLRAAPAKQHPKAPAEHAARLFREVKPDPAVNEFQCWIVWHLPAGRQSMNRLTSPSMTATTARGKACIRSRPHGPPLG